MTKKDPELNKILIALSLNIDDSVVERIEEYLEILFKWHEQNNIISTRDRTYFLQRDFFDSLSMLSHLPKGSVARYWDRSRNTRYIIIFF